MLSRVLVVLVGLALSRVASADPAAETSRSDHSVVGVSQPSRPSWSGDRLALLAHVGIGAPAGALAADLDIAPIPQFALSLGAGVSLGGIQFAATPRLRIASGKHTFITLGSGVSLGRYVNYTESAGLLCLFLCPLEQNGESPARQTWRRAVWYNLELGADVYKGARGLLRITLGYGLILNGQSYTCEEADPNDYGPGQGCGRSSGRNLLFGSFAYGFDI